MSAVDVAFSPIREKQTAVCRGGRRVDLCASESIVVYITVGESLIPVRVMESDSIASVKLRIQACKGGFVVKRHKLVFGGRELWRTESLVKDYGITSGNVLHLALRISDLLLINVRTTCGKELEFQVDRHRNVGYLKRRISKKGQKGRFVNIENPDVFCGGEKLEDERLIRDISDDNDAVIHLVVQKSAKVRTKSVDKDVEISIVARDPNRKPDGTREEDRELSENNEFLYNSHPGIDRDLNGHALSLTSETRDLLHNLEPVIVKPHLKFPPFLVEMMKRVSDGLAVGKQPIRSSEGMGGTYFMQDGSGDKYVAIFKPIDEEPLAANNPQRLPLSSNGEGLKRGTRVGEGALREVAAYLLDHPRSGPRVESSNASEIGFAGVQPTVMVRCLDGAFNHPEGFECSEEFVKIGSLQIFVKNHGSCEDMGPRDFPVEEVHKIGVFDMRTANADRHAGNILMHREGGEEGRVVLIPIDHGYCLPENFEDCTFDWLYWPQVRQPFSQETLDYIKSLDAEQDIALLNYYGLELSPASAHTLRISTALLKKGAERGLTPFAIGTFMCRENLNKKSVLEEILDRAKDSLLPGMSESTFLEAVYEIMDETLDKHSS